MNPPINIKQFDNHGHKFSRDFTEKTYCTSETESWTQPQVCGSGHLKPLATVGNQAGSKGNKSQDPNITMDIKTIEMHTSPHICFYESMLSLRCVSNLTYHWFSKWIHPKILSWSLLANIYHSGPGGRFKNTYELLNLRALKISKLHKNHIFQCMGKIFCVEFQRVPLKFHTKYLTHTLKDVDFIHIWKFKSSLI